METSLLPGYGWQMKKHMNIPTILWLILLFPCVHASQLYLLEHLHLYWRFYKPLQPRDAWVELLRGSLIQIWLHSEGEWEILPNVYLCKKKQSFQKNSFALIKHLPASITEVFWILVILINSFSNCQYRTGTKRTITANEIFWCIYIVFILWLWFVKKKKKGWKDH